MAIDGDTLRESETPRIEGKTCSRETAGGVLSPSKGDVLVRFLVQTRLIFPRTVLLLLGVLFGVCVASIKSAGKWDAFTVWRLLTVETIMIAGLLNMRLFHAERRQNMLDILRSRVGGTNDLLRLKIVPAVFWLIVLLIPAHVGFTWLLGISMSVGILQFVLFMASGVVAALATCVAATFVRTSFASLIVMALMLGPLAFAMNAPGGVVRSAVAPFLCIIGENSSWAKASVSGRVVLTMVNLMMVSLYATGLFAWLRNRLERSEKWFL